MIDWSDHEPRNMRIVRKQEKPDPMVLMMASGWIGFAIGALFMFLCWMIWGR